MADSERFKIIASLAVWAIWKARNEWTINPEEQISANRAKSILKESLKDIIKKSWLSTNLERENKHTKSELKVRALWGSNSLAVLERGKPPTYSF